MSGGIGGIGAGRNVEWGSVPEPEGPQGEAPAAAAAPVRGGAPASDPRVQALLQAFKTEPADKLEKRIIAAKKDDPVVYRSALREYFKDMLPDVSRLKLHNMAMDVNNDGLLTFKEAYDSMTSEGFHRFRAFMLSAMTALFLAPQSNDGKFTTKLIVANSDKVQRSFFRTGFDTDEKLEGRLDEIMAEDLDKDGFVTLKDMERLVDKRTAKMDSKLGAKAINYLNKGEWQALFSLMEGNRMTRDELRDFYTTSLFFSFLPPDNLAKKLVDYRKGTP